MKFLYTPHRCEILLLRTELILTLQMEWVIMQAHTNVEELAHTHGRRKSSRLYVRPHHLVHKRQVSV